MKYANEGIKQLHKYSDTFKFERRIIDLQFKVVATLENLFRVFLRKHRLHNLIYF